MYKNILLLVTALTLGLLAAAPPLADLAPVYSPNTISIPTRFIPGKTLYRYRGQAVQVMSYAQGTPQLNLVKPDSRFGGIAILVDGKTVSGTRTVEGQDFRYVFPDDGSLLLRLMDDGRVHCKLHFPNAKRLAMEIMLKSAFYGACEIRFDNDAVTMPGSAEQQRLRIRDPQPGRSITVAPENPERCFAIQFDEEVPLGMQHYGKNAYAMLEMHPTA
ncbi:MAG: hypothetical protein GX617_05980, partial [Lentisphaerae bacterium]|nr:hypothetical protein [Lentisphaerota bacterium]